MVWWSETHIHETQFIRGKTQNNQCRPRVHETTLVLNKELCRNKPRRVNRSIGFELILSVKVINHGTVETRTHTQRHKKCQAIEISQSISN